MSDYPYLAAVLPTVTFGETEFLSSERFLTEAGKWLAEQEFALLESVSMTRFEEREHPLEIVDEFYRFERMIRQDIADFVENRRLGREHKTRMFSTTVLKDNNPLEAERRLLRLRWDWISARLDTHHGDLHALVVYRIQTEILERLQAFDRKRGETRFAEFTRTDNIEREVRAAS